MAKSKLELKIEEEIRELEKEHTRLFHLRNNIAAQLAILNKLLKD